MTDERGVVRRIAWREVFPWILILRSFRLALSPTLLALATLGALLTPLGWKLGSTIFLEQEERLAWQQSRMVPSPALHLSGYVPPAMRQYLPGTPNGMTEVYFDLSEPVRRLFDWSLSLRQTAFYLFGNLWSLLIWSFVGGVITRCAVVQFGCDESVDIVGAVRFVFRRYFWYVLAPLYPLGGVLLVMMPLALLGLLMRLDFGVVIAGFAWVFVLLWSLIAVWLLLGLIFGWPLMWPAVSAERDGDPFEAFSRSFSYVYGKPLHLFFYFVVAALFGALAWAVVSLGIDLLIGFGFSGASWGSGTERIAEIHQRIATGDKGGSLGFGSQLIGFFVGIARVVKDGYSFSYFFCAAAAIYLLMRFEVDQKELDEVYLEAEAPKFAAAPGVSAVASGAPATPLPQQDPAAHSQEDMAE